MTRVPFRPTTSFTENLDAKEYKYDSTLLIPRQFGEPVVPAIGNSSSTEPCYRSGQLHGQGMDKTILRFSKNATRALVATEGYDDPKKLSSTWNLNRTYTNLRALVENLSIFGPAELSNYPSSIPIPTWDPTGKWHRNHPKTADGLVLCSSGHRAKGVRLWQIPGTGLISTLGSAQTPHVGNFGIYDAGLVYLEDIVVYFALHGVDMQITDSKARNIECSGMAFDAITLSGSAVFLDQQTAHVQNCDRGLVVKGGGCSVEGGYWEAARIAVHVEGTGYGTTLRNVQSLNGTVYDRNFLLEADTDLLGTAINVHPVGHWGFPEIVYPRGTAGVEIGKDRRCTVTGSLTFQPKYGKVGNQNNSDGIICRGSRCEIDVNGGWHGVVRDAGAFVRVIGKCQSNLIKIRGNGPGSIENPEKRTVLVDLSETNLDKTHGLGTRVEVYWNPDEIRSMIPVRYPGGGTEYNLHSGTTVIINGREQN